MTDLLAAALAWHDAGYTVLPAAGDGTKMPAVAWKRYQHQQPTRQQVTTWLADSHGLGLICGQASGNLEMLELEGRAVTEGAVKNIMEIVAAANLTDLWRQVTGGYTELTPSGGMHLLYRVEGDPVAGNTKLARRPATDAELAADPDDRVKVLAETRGEGGWVVIAPSHGTTHPTGKAWTCVRGGPDTVPTITTAQRDQLHLVMRALDQMPAAAPVTPHLQMVRNPNAGVSPGDDLENRVDWADDLLLGGAGWRPLFRRGERVYWRRPGKDTPGISATTGGAADGRDRLYVFSTSTEFQTEMPYTKFGAYALLHHGGDHKAAAQQLKANGYGKLAPLAPDPTAEREALAELLPPRPGSETPRVLAAVDGTAARVIEPAPRPEAFGPTEDGMARALVVAHARDLRYCPQRGKWLRWDGHRWTWDDAERHREMIRALARALPDDDGWRRHKTRCMSAVGVSGVERLARSDAAIVVHVDQLDARPYELNTPAGIIDLRTGELQPPDPHALHTRSTTIAPDFKHRSDVFERFLATTFGADPALTGYVQRLLGVSTIGTVLEQVMPFAHGKGANGKSTLLEAAMQVLGTGETGYAMAAPAEMLMIRRHSEHPAELAQLVGARLVVCSELEDSQSFAEARIKQLTGRDSINARFMRRDPFTFTPSHTMWLLGNHKPAARTGGPAFWRRVRLLPFINVVPEDQRDPHLGEKLAEDGAAILAWIARGAAAYHRDGLADPPIVRTATAAYEHDQDTVGRFVEESCHRAPGQTQVRVWRDELRVAYERWCTQSGETPVDARRLTAEIRDLDGIGEAGVKGRRYFSGICLLAAEGDDDDERQERYR